MARHGPIYYRTHKLHSITQTIESNKRGNSCENVRIVKELSVWEDKNKRINYSNRLFFIHLVVCTQRAQT